MKNVKLLTQKVVDLLDELERYQAYKQQFIKAVEDLFKDYQRGKYTYFQYEQELKKLLKDKTREDWIEYYDAYLYSLLKRIEAYNDQIFYEVYKDKSFEKVEIITPPLTATPAAPLARVEIPQKKPEALKGIPIEKRKEVKLQQAKKAVVEARGPAEEAAGRMPAKEEPALKLPEEGKKFEGIIGTEAAGARKEKSRTVIFTPTFFDILKDKIRNIFKPKPAEETVKPEPRPGASKKFALIQTLKKPLEKKRPEEAKIGAKRPTVEIGFGGGFGWQFIQTLRGRKKETVFTEKAVAVPISTVRMETLRRRAAPEMRVQVEEITTTALTEEAKRIKSILEKRKALKIYQPSFFGALANVTIKKMSLFLLDTFPEFFKELYQTLRLANIKILSNTYVNMMVLGVMSSFFIGLFLFAIIFAFFNLPFGPYVVRTISMSFLLSLVVFAGFYSYPTAKMKTRRKSINTNLSFAINHMGAVAASGVPPTKMFKLIAQSTEYGEISTEIEKIVNYVEIFGYDILTAVKTVSATTPSPQFKEFFDGMISTTQSGGDIKQYLSQKSKEAMLSYKLDRKKYTETISTYSDIYTGILIAAPLFFVAALSMVSLLGGKVGGIDVNIITVIGTYLVIPVLNIAFITFLELTQPEV
jgi:flagellar protein FlaJ